LDARVFDRLDPAGAPVAAPEAPKSREVEPPPASSLEPSEKAMVPMCHAPPSFWRV